MYRRPSVSSALLSPMSPARRSLPSAQKQYIMSSTPANEPLLWRQHAAAAAGRRRNDDEFQALPGESSSRMLVYDLLAEVLSNLDSDACHGGLCLWAKSHDERSSHCLVTISYHFSLCELLACRLVQQQQRILWSADDVVSIGYR